MEETPPALQDSSGSRLGQGEQRGSWDKQGQTGSPEKHCVHFCSVTALDQSRGLPHPPLGNPNSGVLYQARVTRLD